MDDAPMHRLLHKAADALTEDERQRLARLMEQYADGGGHYGDARLIGYVVSAFRNHTMGLLDHG